jgi:acyl-CoA synthetase (NDP forming)
MVDREGDRERIERLFDPDTVAIAGASADPNKRGHTAMRRLIESDFDGAVYPVNPSAEGEILGRPVFATVSAIPTVIDLVYVVTPASAVASVLEDAGVADAAGAVIFSAGFGEAGNDDAEQELVRIAREHDLRFIGPNVMGLVNVPADLYLGIDATYTPGGVSVIS